MFYVFCCMFVLLFRCYHVLFFFFFFNDTATTEIYTLSLHDALPISVPQHRAALGAGAVHAAVCALAAGHAPAARGLDRKSTRLNSSHLVISYAVFCLKKKTSLFVLYGDYRFGWTARAVGVAFSGVGV